MINIIIILLSWIYSNVARVILLSKNVSFSLFNKRDDILLSLDLILIIKFDTRLKKVGEKKKYV